MDTIMITGGAGFIGSNFIRYMLDKYRDYKIINVDALTYAGNPENLSEVACNSNYSFFKADIRDRKAIEKIFLDNEIVSVINFAAESHVDRSIEDPEVFLTTNIIGTQVLLDAAKKHWKIRPEDKHCREYKPGVKFVQISTDEVYGTLGEKGRFSETMPLLPNSPYAASKAGGDLIVRSYHETFGMPVNITRCSNNYGPYQFPEKLIPLIIHNCLMGKELPVYGDGEQIRDWLHVVDHCSAIDIVLHQGKPGEIYNIGGNNEKANIELVKMIICCLGKLDARITHVKDRPGHDRRYAVDSTKITNELGWKPKYPFEKGLRETIQWYLEHNDWMAHIVSGEYADYYKRVYDESAR